MFGVSRQSWYFYKKKHEKQMFQTELLLQLISEIRKKMPRLGCKKLLFLLKEDMKSHNIKMGRDMFFDFMRRHDLLIYKKRRYTKTTNSFHRYYKYPNLIIGFVPCKSNQLYVSDITYIRLVEGFAYLSLITDAYSRKIVGYKLHTTLSRLGCIYALQMALTDLPVYIEDIIHHSDRGVQYCSDEYVTILKHNKFLISMTNNGDPYENAIAERINGILKDEFNLDKTFSDFKEAELSVKTAIERYNTLRPHLSCDMLTPEQAHQKEGELVCRW